ncbi:Alcohol dehydrogenase superfamily zinc-containing [Macrophomina phaseolina MS6]|uniref:Alcohol dehydrogenase superfamily zinc-containing n=1 Tax=Macrophomina phaseolina (strain MS6) TaxID=1126212 RepID=K2S712_MACPH|nr:Alcohol dehydrogenase superfamily zinc-containing [Macrophomina phaseolina MS6]
MSTYKAVVLESPGAPPKVKTVPRPSVAMGSALVRILYTGLLSYSREIFSGKPPYPSKFPYTPGTAAIGRIEAVGLDATSLKAGDVVWVDSTITARDDPDTQVLLALIEGSTPGAKKLSHDVWRNGCYAENALVPLESCFALPDSLFQSRDAGGLGYHFKDLAMLHSHLVGFGGLEASGVGPASTVIVAPATGKFSGGAVLAGLAMGAKVVAAARSREKLEKLHQLPGAKARLALVQLTGDVEKHTASLLASTGGKGADVFVDFSPPAASGPTTAPHITAGINALKRGGQAVLEGGIFTDIGIDYRTVVFKSLVVRGQMGYDRAQIEKFIHMVENGNITLGDRVGLSSRGVFGLERIEEALDLAEKGAGWGGDVLLAPNGEV